MTMYQPFDDWHAASLASSPETERPDRLFDNFHPSPDRKGSGMITSWPAASPSAASVPSEFDETPMKHVSELPDSSSRFPPPKPEPPTCSVAARVSAKHKKKLPAQLEPGQAPNKKKNECSTESSTGIGSNRNINSSSIRKNRRSSRGGFNKRRGVASTEGGDGDNTAAPGAPAAKKKAKKVVEPGEKRKSFPTRTTSS